MRLVSRALFIALPFALGTAVSIPASAQEDSIRQQFEDIKNAAGMGADRPPIDFSERPPLAVPPNYNLPPPGSGQQAGLPINDPDEMARRKALSDARRPVPVTDPGASASGLSARAYLIDPPSGMEDPNSVAAGAQTDGTPKTSTHHRRKHTAAQ